MSMIWEYVGIIILGVLFIMACFFRVGSSWKERRDKGEQWRNIVKNSMIKFLIWVGCLFVASAISALSQRSGNGLGFIPTIILWGLCIFVATRLCRARDQKEE